MIPTINDAFLTDFTETGLPSKDYALDRAVKKVTGTVEGYEAVKQAIYFMLNTERYNHLIYSWDYGIELSDLFGQPYTYVVPEAERRIRECLVQDERITDVTDFAFEKGKNTVHVTFTVITIYGEVESEVNINV